MARRGGLSESRKCRAAVGAASGKKAECCAYRAARRIGRASSARIRDHRLKMPKSRLDRSVSITFLKANGRPRGKGSCASGSVRRVRTAKIASGTCDESGRGAGYSHRTSHEVLGLAYGEVGYHRAILP